MNRRTTVIVIILATLAALVCIGLRETETIIPAYDEMVFTAPAPVLLNSGERYIIGIGAGEKIIGRSINSDSQQRISSIKFRVDGWDGVEVKSAIYNADGILLQDMGSGRIVHHPEFTYKERLWERVCR